MQADELGVGNLPLFHLPIKQALVTEVLGFPRALWQPCFPIPAGIRGFRTRGVHHSLGAFQSDGVESSLEPPSVKVVVQVVVDDGEAQDFQVDPYLVRAPLKRPAADEGNAGTGRRQPVEDGGAVFGAGREVLLGIVLGVEAADGRVAEQSFGRRFRKVSVDQRHVLFVRIAPELPDEVVPALPVSLGQHEDSAGQLVQAVDDFQVAVAQLVGQDVEDGVEPVAVRRVDHHGGRFVDDQDVAVFVDDLDGVVEHGPLVKVNHAAQMIVFPQRMVHRFDGFEVDEDQTVVDAVLDELQGNDRHLRRVVVPHRPRGLVLKASVMQVVVRPHFAMAVLEVIGRTLRRFRQRSGNPLQVVWWWKRVTKKCEHEVVKGCVIFAELI